MMNSKEWFFDSNYSINKLKKFIEHKYDDFKNFGGDMETLFFNVKISFTSFSENKLNKSKNNILLNFTSTAKSKMFSR
jgi:hypothetical protein